ncbi:hypothetical protein HDV05_003007, partial [Chytridiales sp. JEL 0842]
RKALSTKESTNPEKSEYKKKPCPYDGCSESLYSCEMLKEDIRKGSPIKLMKTYRGSRVTLLDGTDIKRTPGKNLRDSLIESLEGKASAKAKTNMVSHSVFSAKPDWSASTPNSGREVDWAALSKFVDAKPVQQNTNSNRDVDWVSLTKAADENLAKPVANSGREVDWVLLLRQSGIVSSGEND